MKPIPRLTLWAGRSVFYLKFPWVVAPCQVTVASLGRAAARRPIMWGSDADGWGLGELGKMRGRRD